MNDVKIARYFVTDGVTTFDIERLSELRKTMKVTVANGASADGFQTVCHVVYLTEDYPHIEQWAESRGIEVVKCGKADPAENKESEIADINTVIEEEKPKRRGRKPKDETE